MNTLELIREVAETIEIIGEDATVLALENARKNCLKPKLVREVFNIVCKELGYKIDSPNDLKVRTDERKVIIAFVSFFAYKKIKDITHTDLSVLCITISKQSMSQYKKVIENANRKSPITNLEKLIAKHYQNINDRINDLLKNK